MSAAMVAPPVGESTMRVRTPEAGDMKPPMEHTVIIFDWDDTLLSSSWLAQNGLRLDAPVEVPPAAAEQLATLQESVCALLRRAIEIGTVIIITNAETGWVELSAKRFMPAVVPLLSAVRVLSARSTYEPLFACPSEWKVHAFAHELAGACAGLHPECVRNVISFGDSVHERHAIHKVTAGVPFTRTKSVKFVERPTIEQLKRQVDLVQSCFSDIIGHQGNLDLMLTIQLLYH